MAILAPPEPRVDIEPKQELVMGIETADAIEPKPPAVAALNIEHLTKQFVVGGRRKKKTVVAVNDISLAHRAGRDLRPARGQWKWQVHLHPAGEHAAHRRARDWSRSSVTTSPARRWPSSG